MNREVIARAINFFLDPDIRRSPNAMICNWVDLRLCLTTDTQKRKKKKEQILPECNTPSKLKIAILEFVLSSQADMLLAMSFKANHEAKQHDKARFQTNVDYCYKCFLLNVLILLFQERHTLIFASRELYTGSPTLLVEVNDENRLNMNLRFYASHDFTTDTQLRLHRGRFEPDHYLGFHLPFIQLIPETEIIIQTGLKPG